jgi:hypothetical protein
VSGIGITVIVGVVLYVLLSKHQRVAAQCGHSHFGASHQGPGRRNQGRSLRHRRRAKVIVLKPEQFEHQPTNGPIIDLKPEDYQVETERSN